MIGVTASEIKIALCKKHQRDFFVTECKSGSTWMAPAGTLKILDGLAIRRSWVSPCFTGYEVKVSRSDFIRDAKFYTYEELVNCLYIVCPKGMIDRTDLPESVGLMYYDPEKKTLTTRKKAIYRKIEYSPDLLLYILYTRLDSDRIPFYSSKLEYFRDYLAGKASSRQTGLEIGSKLLNENIDLKRQLEDVRHFKDSYEEYKAIQSVMHDHGIWGFRNDAAKELDKALSRKCPGDIKDLRTDLERIVFRIKRMEAAGEKANAELCDGEIAGGAT